MSAAGSFEFLMPKSALLGYVRQTHDQFFKPRRLMLKCRSDFLNRRIFQLCRDQGQRLDTLDQ